MFSQWKHDYRPRFFVQLIVIQHSIQIKSQGHGELALDLMTKLKQDCVKPTADWLHMSHQFLSKSTNVAVENSPVAPDSQTVWLYNSRYSCFCLRYLDLLYFFFIFFLPLLSTNSFIVFIFMCRHRLITAALHRSSGGWKCWWLILFPSKLPRIKIKMKGNLQIVFSD